MSGGITAFIAEASPRFSAWRAARRYRALQGQAAVLLHRIAEDDLQLQYIYEEMRTLAEQAAGIQCSRLTAANDAPPPLAAMQRHMPGGKPCA